MNFSISSLLAGLIFGVIGMWLFKTGRRKNNIQLIVISLLMMSYSFFTRSEIQDWGIGLLLCSASYYYW